MFSTQAMFSCSLVVLWLVFVEQIREQMLLKYLVGENGYKRMEAILGEIKSRFYAFSLTVNEEASI